MKNQINNQLQIFENEEFGKVRVLYIDGEPWFVGKEIAGILGYGEGKKNSSALNNAVKAHVNAEDKGVTKTVTPGGKQNTVIINESGLYSLNGNMSKDAPLFTAERLLFNLKCKFFGILIMIFTLFCKWCIIIIFVLRLTCYVLVHYT